MNHKTFLRFSLPFLAFWVMAGPTLHAAPELLWKGDFSTAKAGASPGGGAIADDPAAQGGKALRLVFAKLGPLPAIFTAHDLPLAGHVVVRVWARGQDLNDIANGLRLAVTLTDAKTGDRFLGDGMVYGIRGNGNTFRSVSVALDVAAQPALYTLSVAPFWQAQHGDRKPTVWIDRAELEAPGKSVPFISGFTRSKIIYAPGDDIHMTATVVNPTQAAFSGKLTAQELFGLDGKRDGGIAAVSLAPGEVRSFDLTWKAALPESGREIDLSLADQAGKALDQDNLEIGVAKDGRLLAFPTQDFGQGPRYHPGADVLWSPASRRQVEMTIQSALDDPYDRDGRREIYAWSWGDITGFIAPEDPYLSEEIRLWVSLEKYKELIAGFKGIGFHVVSYAAGEAWAEPGYEVYQKHPDWFLYDNEGEILGQYNMESHARYADRHDLGAKLPEDVAIWANMDPTLPEVRQEIADQFIQIAKELGFEGARWDVWNMTVKPGWRRLDGTILAKTPAEADRMTAESIKAVKALVAKEVPDFTWGYNFGAPEENADTPLTIAEKCKDHGWILDETAIGYMGKASPFHYWDAYRKRMIEWGDHIRQLDGIYDPWAPDRGFQPTNPDHVEIDWLYTSIFRILAGGRAWNPLYKNNDALAGDLPGLAFRFSNTYSGWNLRLQPENQTRISVDGPSTLWWKGSVFTNKSAEGTEQAIVHLVNSPLVDQLGDNKDSKVRPPVLKVKVTCGALGGHLPRKAWLVSSEPVRPDGEAKIQETALSMTRQGDGAVSVTVPSVFYLKTVVFEY